MNEPFIGKQYALVNIGGSVSSAEIIAMDVGYVCLKAPGKKSRMTRASGVFDDDDGKTVWVSKGELKWLGLSR